jgi:DNA-binding transcriptional MerR regulator
VSEEGWRIDELAQRSGTSVDTIRFYQREGLVPPGQRRGRAAVYGPQHLHQLERIRDLQARHFSLGAIKALSDEGRLGLVEALFAGGSRSYGPEQLAEESGLGEELVARLMEAGLPAPPAEHGSDSYEHLDLQALQAVRGLMELGMPQSTVLSLVRIYTAHFAAIQQDVIALFVEERGEPTEEMRRFQSRAAPEIDSLMALVQTILNYAHHRAVQRIALTVIQRGSTAEGADALGSGR